MAQFVDHVVLHLQAGAGGHGAASVHREKFKPLGGPDGGNGGHGGDILLEVSGQAHTLLDFHFRPHIKAERGGNGAGDNRMGARGKDVVLYVPAGTVVKDQSGNTLADLVEEGTRFMAAEGGLGGLGNAALANHKRKAPGFALKGEPGEERELVLELKSMADVGLVGFPSAGKSSLISVLSAARPKIGDYPFTTLQPNLGVVGVGDETFTVADVPGLIPGASQGKGLGLEFLRHIERTSVLVHVVDCATIEPGRDPVSDIEALEHELGEFQDALEEDTGLGDLRKRPRVVVLNKADVPEAEELAEFVVPELEERFGWPVFIVSAVARKGLDPLRYKLLEIVTEHRRDQERERRRSRRGEAAPVQVIRPRPVDEPAGDFEVLPDVDHPGEFVVRGRKPERWISQTDFENDEAVGFLADRMNKAGIEDALKAAGAVEGCTVTIGGVSFEWEPLTPTAEDVTFTSRGHDPRLERTERSTAAQRKRASQARRGLIDEEQYEESEEGSTERWQG
ncbi:GTPase ObgE [Corynebacterium otitidis]